MTGLYGTKGINKRHFLVNTLFLDAYIYCDVVLDDLLQKISMNQIIRIKNRNIKLFHYMAKLQKNYEQRNSIVMLDSSILYIISSNKDN